MNKTAPIASEPTSFKMVRTTDVRNGWVNTQDLRSVDEHTFERWTRRLQPRQGDVILTREAPLGEVGILRSDETVFLGQRLVMYRVDPTRCDARFLLYAMLGPTTQQELRRLGSGSTVEHLRVGDCEDLPIWCPSLPTQRRIADVLWAFDELVENNLRQIKLLEETARSLYQEWFVRYRTSLSGESSRRIGSDGIPLDWSLEPLSAAVEVNPTAQIAQGVTVPFITMRDVRTTDMVVFPSETRQWSGSGSRFVNGDTLFARISPCTENGKTAYVQSLLSGEVGAGSTEFLVLRGRRLGPEHTYLLTRDERIRSHAIASMSGSSGRQRVVSACFDSLLVPVPPVEISRAFQSLTQPMFTSAHTAATLARRVLSARDMLLPKLVTGQIDVDSLGVDDVFGWTELAEALPQ